MNYFFLVLNYSSVITFELLYATSMHKFHRQTEIIATYRAANAWRGNNILMAVSGVCRPSRTSDQHLCSAFLLVVVIAASWNVSLKNQFANKTFRWYNDSLTKRHDRNSVYKCIIHLASCQRNVLSAISCQRSGLPAKRPVTINPSALAD